MLSHQGSKVDRVLAQAVPGIDIIVGAHSHDEISPPERLGSTWLVQALSDAAVLGELTLTLGPDRRLTTVSGRVHTLWADELPAGCRGRGELIERLRAPHRSELEAPIATTAERIGRQYKSESPFDALAGEILRDHTGAEIAFLPGVGYGVSLEPGVVTREALATLLPHPTKVATVTLRARRCRKCSSRARPTRNPPTRWTASAASCRHRVCAGRWTSPGRSESGCATCASAMRRSRPARSYRVVTNQGMLQGLHRYTTFARGRDAVVLEQTMGEVVEAAFRQRGTLRAPAPGHVRLIQ